MAERLGSLGWEGETLFYVSPLYSLDLLQELGYEG